MKAFPYSGRRQRRGCTPFSLFLCLRRGGRCAGVSRDTTVGACTYPDISRKALRVGLYAHMWLCACVSDVRACLRPTTHTCSLPTHALTLEVVPLPGLRHSTVLSLQ